MDSPTETLEEWAAREELGMTAEQWGNLDRWVELGSNVPSALLVGLTPERARALLAHRGKVVANMSEDWSRAIGKGDLRALQNFEWMRDGLGIVDGDCELTDFGRECARVLREDG